MLCSVHFAVQSYRSLTADLRATRMNTGTRLLGIVEKKDLPRSMLWKQVRSCKEYIPRQRKPLEMSDGMRTVGKHVQNGPRQEVIGSCFEPKLVAPPTKLNGSNEILLAPGLCFGKCNWNPEQDFNLNCEKAFWTHFSVQSCSSEVSLQ